MSHKPVFCVIGGAGYVGSQSVQLARDLGYDVVVYDNLSTGHRDLIPQDVPLVQADVCDVVSLTRCLKEHKVDAILHCAALSLVPESVAQPGRYWFVNVGGAGSLVQAAKEAGIKAIVFSSSAAVYGEPVTDLITEDHPLSPINPYGRTKAVVEQVLADSQAAGGPPWIAFRYFNAAGADLQGRCGERHHPETHLIPNILIRAKAGTNNLTLYGDDYPTRDGTCVRDYIHTLDLAHAHILALNHLLSGGESMPLNLGSGTGTSLLEMIHAAQQVTGTHIPYTIGPRRPGDPAQLVADATKAKRVLKWTPQRSDIKTILEDAWRWTGSETSAT